MAAAVPEVAGRLDATSFQMPWNAWKLWGKLCLQCYPQEMRGAGRAHARACVTSTFKVPGKMQQIRSERADVTIG